MSFQKTSVRSNICLPGLSCPDKDVCKHNRELLQLRGFENFTRTSATAVHAAETVSHHAGVARTRRAAEIAQHLIISLVTFGKHSSLVSHRQRGSLSRCI